MQKGVEMAENNRSWFFQNLANFITVFGLIFSVWLIFLVIIDPQSILLITVLSALIGFSDFADGKIARHLKIKSLFGTALDRLRDKIFICTILIALFCNFCNRLNEPLYIISLTGALVVIAVFLECCIFGRWLYDLIKGFDVTAGQSGRIKMFIQFFIVIIWLVSLMIEKYANYFFLDNMIYPLDILLIVANYFSTKSLIGYFKRNSKIVK